MVAGRHIIRATPPVSTVPTVQNSSVSGLGDLNVFDAIVVTSWETSTTFGAGPLLVVPSTTDDALGAPGTWPLGAAAVALKLPQGGSPLAALPAWQNDFPGGDDRVNINLMTV